MILVELEVVERLEEWNSSSSSGGSTATLGYALGQHHTLHLTLAERRRGPALRLVMRRVFVCVSVWVFVSGIRSVCTIVMLPASHLSGSRFNSIYCSFMVGALS